MAENDEKNARLEMKLKVGNRVKSGVGCDISLNQWEALNAIVDGVVDPSVVLLAAREAAP